MEKVILKKTAQEVGRLVKVEGGIFIFLLLKTILLNNKAENIEKEDDHHQVQILHLNHPVLQGDIPINIDKNQKK